MFPLFVRPWFYGAILCPALNFSAIAADPAPALDVASELKRLTLAPGLTLDLFAAEPLLENPVAFAIDGRGRVFLAESHRWATSVLDITQHTDWLLHDLSFRSVSERENFLLQQYAIDPSFLTRASEKVRLVEDQDQDFKADHSTIVADGFNSPVDGTAAGILVHGDDVWFANIPHLWRLSSQQPTPSPASRTQGQAHPPSPGELAFFPDNRVSLANGFGVHIGVSGHDLHGLIKGPDGRLYMSFGDRGANITNREGQIIYLPDTGGVLRCEPDGQNLEIFCSGLRNPQELAFDDWGNLWTVDNDTAGPDPCRVLHLVRGADYGWRCSYQHMKQFGPWVTEQLWKGQHDGILPSAGVVSQGPAGLAFYPGTGWDQRFAGMFLHADFPGGIWAFSVTPLGGSYVVKNKEKVLWNVWPTDVDFGPEGGLYVLDWVAGWGAPKRGRIYRLLDLDSTASAPDETREVARILAAGMNDASTRELLNWLGHKDRRVRLEAQWELAKRGAESLDNLLETALGDANSFPRIHALWAVGQIARQSTPSTYQKVSESLASLVPLLEVPDLEVRAQTAKLLGQLNFIPFRPLLPILLTDQSPRVRFLTAQGIAEGIGAPGFWRPGLKERIGQQLVKLAIEARMPASVWEPLANATHEKALPPIPFAALPLQQTSAATSDPSGFVTFSLAALLSEAATLPHHPEGLAALGNASRHPDPAVRRIALHAHRRLRSPAIAEFLTDTDNRLVVEAARAINDIPIPEGYEALAQCLSRSSQPQIASPEDSSNGPRPDQVQILLRALNAHYRLGEEENAQELIRFAAGTNHPTALRTEALFLLGQWEVKAFASDAPKIPRVEGHGAMPVIHPESYPQWFNRVNGLWQPLPLRSAHSAKRALLSAFSTFISELNPAVEVEVALLHAAAALQLPNIAGPVLSLIQNRTKPAEVRAEAIRTLARVAPEGLAPAIRLALQDPAPAVRIATLNMLEQVEPREILPQLEQLLATEKEVVPRQAALRALGKTTEPRAAMLLSRELGRLLTGEVAAEVQLDLLLAARSHTTPELREQLQRYETSFSPSDRLAPHRPLLAGGDTMQGREIFFTHPAAQCLRCHKVNSEGGIVGPDLTGIGSKQSREYILEAILFPNLTIASGFETATLQLQNGASLTGIVVREDESVLELNTSEDGIVTVSKTTMVSRARGLSAMPEGMDTLLTPRQLRDLIAYLASLKSSP